MAHDETKCINCRDNPAAEKPTATEAVQEFERVSADDSPENSVCAERSGALSNNEVITAILDAAFSPTFARGLTRMIAEMGEEVRRQERERVVSWLRAQAAEAKANRDHEISVYVPPTLADVAERIELGEHGKESSNAAE